MFITVKFHEEATRTYTYAYDGGQPLATGDRVTVDTQKDGLKTVIVECVDVPEPPFSCKQIIGIAEDEE